LAPSYFRDLYHMVDRHPEPGFLFHTAQVSAPPELPELVVRALRMSLVRGYVQASRTETGRLLATLAATRTGTIAECGTGCGVGAAWLRSGAPKDTRVITAELDPELAHGVMDMFADDDIDVMHADWSSLAEHGPFSLIFMDAASAKSWPREEITGLLDNGGMIVLDDFIPCPTWPPLVRGRVDTLRLDWLADERFTSVDVMVAEDTSVIIAVKK
jgi:predicted O-methyltransferase YrrM